MIKFEKIQLGSKHLNTRARDMTNFYKSALANLKCDNCKETTYVTYRPDGVSYVRMDWDYCCPDFENKVKAELSKYHS
jgi:hypothetical protein